MIKATCQQERVFFFVVVVVEMINRVRVKVQRVKEWRLDDRRVIEEAVLPCRWRVQVASTC